MTRFKKEMPYLNRVHLWGQVGHTCVYRQVFTLTILSLEILRTFFGGMLCINQDFMVVLETTSRGRQYCAKGD